MRIKSLLLVLALPLFINCASDELGALEAAQFALDAGDYDTAITEAETALAADATNVDASRILGSAYFGRSGIDFFDLSEGVLDLSESTDSNFQQIADVLPSTATAADLRSAITSLLDADGIDGADLDGTIADAAFDLGLMEAIESFSIGVYSSDYFGTFDVSAISDDDAASVQEDLINFDNHLIEAGIDSTESFIAEIRQTYCVLEPISAGEGFTTEEYQCLVGCQLDDNPDTFDTATLSGGTIATCAALDPTSQSADVEACYDADTTL